MLSARFFEVLIRTLEKAISDADLPREAVQHLPIFFGSTAIDIPIYEEAYRTDRNVLSRTSAGYGNIADILACRLESEAACYTFTTACTSSANALLFATNLIARGFMEKALVVGFDLFSNVGFYGFEALRLITPSPYRPFDRRRQGIIMGEGCGAVVLDRNPCKATDFHLLGGANGCDPYSVTTHDTEGGVIAEVMRTALHQAGISPLDITAVKAHATGSYHNDLTECSGLRKVFEDRIPPVTGLKPFIGHTVGACGVIELILFSEAVKKGFIPAMLGFEEFDPELAVTPLTRPMRIETGNFLLNYFGFGGNSVSLVVSNVYP